MNFDEAVKAHSDWKLKLSSYLRRPDGSIRPEDVEPDNRCALGKWIYGEGASHKEHAEFGSLKTEHGKFHKAAADVIRKADSGQNITEEIAIGSKSAFGTASTAVVSAILSLKRKLK